MSTAPRLFVTDPLASEAELSLGPDHARYLSVIMRRGVGDSVRLFNGADGEWRAAIVEEGKKTLRVRCEEKTRDQIAVPDLHLLFSPVKKARTDFIVEKATELGVRALRPVLTERSNAERVRTDRFAAIAREAAEQTERLDLPEVWRPEKLAHVLRDWDAGRPMIYCDEAGDDETAAWGGTTGRAPAALETLRNALLNSGPSDRWSDETLSPADVLAASPSPLGEGRGGGRPEAAVRAVAHARRMRAAPTQAEARLWELLRGLKRPGAHFRRQAVIGPFIVDFACLSAKLVIEADGGGHGGSQDRERDAWLRDQGYRVIRIWNSDILDNPAGVADQVDVILSERLQEHPTPSLPLRGGRATEEASQFSPSPLEEVLRRYDKVAVLIGPEGGFSPTERDRLRAHDNVIPVSLGPRILRADTASVAALTLVQAVWGDWR